MLHYAAALNGDIRHTLLARVIPSHAAEKEGQLQEIVHFGYLQICGQYSQLRGTVSAHATCLDVWAVFWESEIIQWPIDVSLACLLRCHLKELEHLGAALHYMI